MGPLNMEPLPVPTHSTIIPPPLGGSPPANGHEKYLLDVSSRGRHSHDQSSFLGI
jgi:hypothetical protein